MMNIAQSPMLSGIFGGLTPPVVVQRKNAATAGTSFSVSFNSIPADGSYLLVGINSGVDASIPNAPAGWTLIHNQVSPSPHRLRIWEKIASGEPASYTWTQAQNRGLSWQSVEISGIDGTTYEDLEWHGHAKPMYGFSPAKDVLQGRLVLCYTRHSNANTMHVLGDSFDFLNPVRTVNFSCRTFYRRFVDSDVNISISYDWEEATNAGSQIVALTYKGL